MNSTMRTGKSEIIVLALIIAFAAALRVYDANTQLWLDEISAWLNGIQRPLLQIVTEWPGVASHILFEALSHLSVTVFGFSPLSLRLPAIVFGVLSVYTMYRITRLLGDWKFALFAAAMLAVSYHHIYYSQNARGYTTLIFFFLASSECVLRMLKPAQPRALVMISYVVLGTLVAYAHPFGALIIAGQGIFLIGHDSVSNKRLTLSWTRLLPFMSIGLLTLVLYAPFLKDIFSYAASNAAMYGSEQPSIESSLLDELLNGLLSAFMGWPGLIVAFLAMLAGTTAWLLSHRSSFFLLGIPVALQIIVFVGLGFGLHPRYFVIALPCIYIAAAFSLAALFNLIRTSWRDKLDGPIYVLVVLASALPLFSYYRYPMQDYEAALRYMQIHQAPGDLRFGIHSSGSVLTEFYGQNYPRINTLEELQSEEEAAANIWLIVSLEPIIAASQPELIAHIHKGYQRRAHFPGTVGNGAVSVYFRSMWDPSL